MTYPRFLSPNQSKRKSLIWNRRNDSTNMSASLRDQQVMVCNTASLEIITDEDSKSSNRKPVVVSRRNCICALSPRYRYRDCYCTKNPISPTYFKKLDDKICQREKNSTSRKLHMANRLNGYIYDNVRDGYYTPASFQRFCNAYNEKTPCSKMNDTICHRDVEVQYTPSREKYEDSKKSPTFEQEYKKTLDECSRSEKKVKAGDKDDTRYLKGQKKQTDVSKPPRSPSPTGEKKGAPSARDKSGSPVRKVADLQKSRLLSGVKKDTSNGRSSWCSPTSGHQRFERGTSTNVPMLEKLQDVCKVKLLESCLETERDLKSLSTFRKDNYFDCHNVDKTCKKFDDHQCTYKFEVNERLIPQPVYANSFGVCSCLVCDKPLDERLPITFSKRLSKQATSKESAVRASKSPTVKESIRNAQEQDSSQIIKKAEPEAVGKICTVENPKQKIEIRVPLNLNDDFGTAQKNAQKSSKKCTKASKTRPKVVVPSDSLALRHQKIWRK